MKTTLRDIGRGLASQVEAEHTLTRAQIEQAEFPLGKALRDLEAAVRAEDARMRSEVLPTPPGGFRWVSALSTSDDLVSSGVTVRLVYRLEALDGSA